jgi:hypothetical protein
MRHQEGAEKARRYAHKGGKPIQLEITEFDFEFDVHDTYDIGF